MTFFPILTKKYQYSKNIYYFKIVSLFCFLKIVTSFSQHMQMLRGDILLEFNGNSMCNG